MKTDYIHHGDCLEWLRTLPGESVDCVVTSPPYWGLRDYGVAGQYGQEASFWEYLEQMVSVFSEINRVIKTTGTLWLNLGDCWASAGKDRTFEQAEAKSTLKGGKKTQRSCVKQISKIGSGFKRKDLIGQPWRVALALQENGWWLRQDIIWHKPNPMPESVTDRCTCAHEYIFLLSKSQKYYFDNNAIREGEIKNVSPRANPRISDPDKKGRYADKQAGHGRRHAGFNDRWDKMTLEEQQSSGRNKRDVWTVAPKPFKGAHFATFPPKLIEPCILAGCPEGGIVLDPFMGSGTTAFVAKQNRRHFVGSEINAEYIEIAEKRLNNVTVKLF